MANEYGDQKILSLGAASGEINGISAPYTIHLGSGKTLYLPSQEVSKQPAAVSETQVITLSSDNLRRVNQRLWRIFPTETMWEGETMHFCSTPFQNGFYMEVRLHGRENAPAWADAVLRTADSVELCVTDPKDFLLGTWKMKYHGIEYTTIVQEEKEGI